MSHSANVVESIPSAPLCHFRRSRCSVAINIGKRVRERSQGPDGMLLGSKGVWDSRFAPSRAGLSQTCTRFCPKRPKNGPQGALGRGSRAELQNFGVVPPQAGAPQY